MGLYRDNGKEMETTMLELHHRDVELKTSDTWQGCPTRCGSFSA